MNIMFLTFSLRCSFIHTREESNKTNKVIHRLSNQQMRNKLQRGDLDLRPLVKPNSDIILNDQLSQRLKLIEFKFNMNIMSFNIHYIFSNKVKSLFQTL